jgi:GNAT superfamily N-acetyltransferase
MTKNMNEIIQTDSSHPEFLKLVKLLDAYLAEVDGTDHAFYDQFNKIDNLNHVVLLMEDGKAVSCGAMKEYAPGVMEIKRMFTLPAYRGRHLAATVLYELEKWAWELYYEKCILETGRKQTAAVALYRREGYKEIPNYEPYTYISESVCFEKEL